jgi:hypothetical protein
MTKCLSKVHARTVAPLILFAVVVACGGEAALPPTNPPDFGMPCISSAVSKITLVSPTPNSVGNPDDFGPIVLGSTATLANGTFQAFVAGATLTPTGQVAQQSFQYYGVLIPTAPPAQRPDGFTFFYVSSDLGITWPAKSTISVYLGNQNAGCLPTILLGSFSLL